MRRRLWSISLLALVPGALLAQVQIGGGICSSASLSGNYSLTLNGRDLSSSVVFSKISEGVGTAVFDGQNKVTFTLTTNTNKTPGVPQTLSGTYSLQANCLGAVTLTSGDTASFTLEAYNNPDQTTARAFLVTGQDGTYAFTGSGSVLPTAACTAALLNGTYAFNATSFGLASGAVSSLSDVSGVLTFDGKSAVTGIWYVSSASTTSDTVTGQFAVTSDCTGTVSLTDGSGVSYAMALTITSGTGANFTLNAASPVLMFTGSGRTL